MTDRGIHPALIRTILAQYTLRWDGMHGLPHWARVLENGEFLAKHTGADGEVVALFAVFHDCCRLNEGSDNDHGRRGAELARSLRGSLVDLDDRRFELLDFACTHHTRGMTVGDITVQTCWDADRLDLGRVGITPNPRWLCTACAKDRVTILWADDPKRRRQVPAIVQAWMAAAGDTR